MYNFNHAYKHVAFLPLPVLVIAVGLFFLNSNHQYFFALENLSGVILPHSEVTVLRSPCAMDYIRPMAGNAAR